MKISLIASLFIIFFTNNVQANEDNTSTQGYDECILKHMTGVTNEYAAKKISESCSNIYSPDWEEAGLIEAQSTYTENNHDRKEKYVSCSSSLRSPEGKYCASSVRISIDLTEAKKKDLSYSYRFKPISTNSCPVKLLHGNNGWYSIESCTFNNDKTKFDASIKGWTSPQQFAVTIPLEKRRK